MPINLILIKSGNSLVADDAVTMEMLAKVPNGTSVRAVLTIPRNIKHHRLLFALLNTVYEAQPHPKRFPTVYHVLDALKEATGHVEEYIDIQGNIKFKPKSIDFANMCQIEFSQWFESAVDVILQYVLPNCEKAGLEEQIMNMLGETPPSALER